MLLNESRCETNPRWRVTLHDAVDERFLEYLAINPAYRTAWSASRDDEPVTDGDAAAIARAREEVRTGKVIANEDVLREFRVR